MIRQRWNAEKSYKETCMIILQDNLSALRAKADITQEELSNIIGVSRQTYYAIEGKKKVLSWNTYLSLIFFYSELDSTKEMLNELKVFPLELIMQFNEQIIFKQEG